MKNRLYVISATVIVMAILVLLVIAISTTLVGGGTPFSPFSLEPGESLTMPYHVNKDGGPLTAGSSPTAIGYMILATEDPGHYSLLMTTDRPEDEVEIEWRNTFVEQKCNKFSCEDVHLWGVVGFHNSCISDRNSDCITTMELIDAREPMLQIWIAGKGTGNITITRTG